MSPEGFSKAASIESIIIISGLFRQVQMKVTVKNAQNFVISLDFFLRMLAISRFMKAIVYTMLFVRIRI